MSSTEELYQIADELRAVASLGLRFAENGYDVERYKRVLAASARLMGVLEQIKFHMYWAVFLIEASHAEPIAGTETIAAAFFEENTLPALSPGHHLIVPRIFRMLRGEQRGPFFDPVDKDGEE